MPLNWNEIRERATRFARDWEGESDEKRESQTFWNGFFEVFGVQRRTVGLYEKRVDLLGGRHGFIDLFWPGRLLAEHKSRGKDLGSAFLQASEYALALKEEERPRYIIVSDFERIRFYDLEPEEGGEKEIEFPLTDLPKKVRFFGFIAGYELRKFKDEDPINIKAVTAVARLYETLTKAHYPEDRLKLLLIRFVFCFFADDSGIFPKQNNLLEYLTYFTREDGTDLGAHLHSVFEVLNTPEGERQSNLHADLATLPYVNGGIFAEPLPLPSFDKEMRKALLTAAEFDWSGVSPAIFGSMFQSVMDEKARHDLGAHYTSEKNILKVINPLFMDALREEFQAAGANRAKLLALQGKLASLKFLDPACGCGNFLVVAYRELRLLELEIIKILYAEEIAKGARMLSTDIASVSKLSVEQMHGIEIEEFPALIARLALWLTDHQMNVALGSVLGQSFTRLPLREAPHIVQGNALRLDWESVVPKRELSYMMGNPPFIGSKLMTEEQREEITSLFGEEAGSGILDYVTGWYKKAADYIQGTKIECAFVSTNSITQGEQVGVLWETLKKSDISIHFAHRTFKWSNEAPGKAAVYCVIIGFAALEPGKSTLFDYEDVRSEPHELTVKRINPYLVDGPDVIIRSRSHPLCDVPEMGIGNKPIDGGFYLFTPEDKAQFLKDEPSAMPYFRRWLGAEEFLNGYERWCLWLGEAKPEDLKKLPKVMRRIQAVREFRLLSKSAPTKKLAERPTRFHVENIPTSPSILIPRHSSERRQYIPFGVFDPSEVLVGDSSLILPNASSYHFGVIQSHMHMSWVRQICGRLKSDYRYSKDIVYNNFPWPEDPSDEQKKAIEAAAQKVLDVRTEFPNATLADLYDPDTMPKALLDAHKDLDRAVDAAYGKRSFPTELSRLEFLFDIYRKYGERK